MTVIQVARRLGVAAAVVRYYMRIGLLSPARDGYNRYHRFSGADIDRLRFILGARHVGLRLRDIRGLLDLHEREGCVRCEQVRPLLESRLRETHQQLDELRELERRLDTALQRCRSEGDCAVDFGLDGYRISEAEDPSRAAD